MLTPKPYEIYKHFKGNCYQIVCIAQDSEDGEKVVVYQGLYAPYKIYSRKLSMFLEEVDRDKYPEAKQRYRFELLDSDGFIVNREMRVNDAQDIFNSTHTDKNADKNISENISENIGENTNESSDVNNSNPVEIILDEQKQEEINNRRQQASKINPVLAKFLDAETDDEQLEIINNYREEITEDILVPMELSLGMEVGEGRLADRIFAIKNCLELKKRYERSNRH